MATIEDKVRSRIREAINPEDFIYIIKNFSEYLKKCRRLERFLLDRVELVTVRVPKMKDFLENIDFVDEINAIRAKPERNLPSVGFNSQTLLERQADIDYLMASKSDQFAPLADMELAYCWRVFKAKAFNASEASLVLGITKKSLVVKMKKILAIVGKNDRVLFKSK